MSLIKFLELLSGIEKDKNKKKKERRKTKAEIRNRKGKDAIRTHTLGKGRRIRRGRLKDF